MSVAGDASAFVALQPLSSDNAGTYVSTESDDTVALDLDGDNGGPGDGVNQDAITQVEDLFRVVNQGSQTTSVYFADGSDAVTFRVTRSTNTETNGSNGQSLEGADNSVELDVGEQVVVGLTVDTLNNDVSGRLLDNVTLYAEAGASAPQQSIPEPQYVVDGAGEGPNSFASLSGALASSDVDEGAVIGIERSQTITEESQVTVSKSVTIAGIDGTPTIDATGFSGDGGAIDVTANSVTLQNFELQYSDDDEGPATNGIEAGQGLSGLTVDGLVVSNEGSVTGQPAINAEDVDDIELTNNEVSGGAIGVFFPSGAASGTSTISGNYVDANPGGSGDVTEGIFIYGAGLPNKDLEVRSNRVDNHGSSSREIKLGTANSPSVVPASVSGQSALDDQFNELLTENDVNTVQIADGDGVTVDADASGSNAYAGIQAGLTEAGDGGYVLVRAGTYDSTPVTVDQSGVTVEAADVATPTIDASGTERGLDIKADGVTIRGLTVDSAGSGVSSGEVEGIFIGNPNGFTDVSGDISIEDVDITNVAGADKSAEGIHVKHYDAGDPIDGVRIANVAIDGVDSAGAGANGIKLQSDVNDIDITDTTISGVTGVWGYGVVLTPSSAESGVPGDVSFASTTINGIDPRTYAGTGVGVDSASGDPEPATSGGIAADPDALSFTDTVIQNADIGILERNTNKQFTAPSGVEFRSVRTEVEDPSS